MFLRTILTVSSLALASGSAVAADENLLSFVVEVETPQDVEDSVRKALDSREPADQTGLTDGGISLATIINLGKEAWKIIVANQPVADVKYHFANALPQGTRANELDGFSDLQMKSYRIYGVNGFGSTVYDTTVTLVHQFGGSYEGRGKYLETVAVVPSNVSVLWGYKLNYNVNNVAVVNVGTSEAPVASLSMAQTLEVSTVLKKQIRNTVVQFRGDTAQIKTTGF
jgi:hypothetical protein